MLSAPLRLCGFYGKKMFPGSVQMARHYVHIMPNPDLTALRAQLAPTLAALEAERLHQQRTCSQAALWCLGLGVVGALAIAGASGGFKVWTLAAPVVALIIYIVVVGGANKQYGAGFKMMVMPQLVKSFGDLTYMSNSGLSEADFRQANLYQRPDRYSCEDLIEGRVGVTRLRMSEIHAENREQRTDSQGRTTTHYTTIFRGLFVIADFNKNFAGSTYVLPEGLSGVLGSFGRGIQSLGGTLSGRGALIQLEDPDFERAFVVYGSDQTEARYILSSALMRRLMNLKQQFNSDVSAAFIGGSLYLMVAKRDNWFEPPSLGTPLTFEGIETTLRQLQMATGIVEDLDLNTRIWSKQ